MIATPPKTKVCRRCHRRRTVEKFHLAAASWMTRWWCIDCIRKAAK